MSDEACHDSFNSPAPHNWCSWKDVVLEFYPNGEVVIKMEVVKTDFNGQVRMCARCGFKEWRKF